MFRCGYYYCVCLEYFAMKCVFFSEDFVCVLCLCDSDVHFLLLRNLTLMVSLGCLNPLL